MKTFVILLIVLSSCSTTGRVNSNYVAPQKAKKATIKNNNDIKIMVFVLFGVIMWVDSLTEPL